MGEIKRLRLRRADVCNCGAPINQGDVAGWDRAAKAVICLSCLEPESSTSIEVVSGTPGGSLQREYERRVAAREGRVMARFPRMGRVLLRISGPVHTTEAFAKGAEGEREVARLLERKLDGEALFLYNRRLGVGERYGDIDMIVIVQSGIYVIDPKKYAGRKVRAGRRGDIFIVDGRERTSLATSMRKHLDAVASVMQGKPMPVSAAYCFVGADLPRTTLKVDGVPALNPRRVVKLLKRPGPFGPDDRSEMHSYLHAKLPPA